MIGIASCCDFNYSFDSVTALTVTVKDEDNTTFGMDGCVITITKNALKKKERGYDPGMSRGK